MRRLESSADCRHTDEYGGERAALSRDDLYNSLCDAAWPTEFQSVEADAAPPFDQGSEMRQYKKFASKTAMKVYFCPSTFALERHL